MIDGDFSYCDCLFVSTIILRLSLSSIPSSVSLTLPTHEHTGLAAIIGELTFANDINHFLAFEL